MYCYGFINKKVYLLEHSKHTVAHGVHTTKNEYASGLICYRFMVCFPIGLDFLFITFLLHVLLGLPTGLLPSTTDSIHFFPQGHQHTQHRTTADQNTHMQDQRHHSSKRVFSTKRHDVTTLPHRGHRHRILHTTRHQHTRLNTHR